MGISESGYAAGGSNEYPRNCVLERGVGTYWCECQTWNSDIWNGEIAS